MAGPARSGDVVTLVHARPHLGRRRSAVRRDAGPARSGDVVALVYARPHPGRHRAGPPAGLALASCRPADSTSLYTA